MSMKDTLMNDLKSAMKEKNVIKKSVITMLRAAIKQIEIDTREELNDEQIIGIVQKQVKQKKAALEDFMKADRADLVDETNSEIQILTQYLPEQLSVEELTVMVKSEIEALGANSMKDMGKVMATLKEKTAGKADGSTLSKLVKEMLQ